MDKLRIVAKETHTRYGTWSQPEILLIFKNARIVKTIITHKPTMVSKAKKGECKPKNTIDQATFKISCTANTLTALFLLVTCARTPDQGACG